MASNDVIDVTVTIIELNFKDDDDDEDPLAPPTAALPLPPKENPASKVQLL